MQWRHVSVSGMICFVDGVRAVMKLIYMKLDIGDIERGGKLLKNIEKQDIENKREKEGRTYQMWRFELCLYKRNFSNQEINTP